MAKCVNCHKQIPYYIKFKSNFKLKNIFRSERWWIYACPYCSIKFQWRFRMIFFEMILGIPFILLWFLFLNLEIPSSFLIRAEAYYMLAFILMVFCVFMDWLFWRFFTVVKNAAP